MNIFGFLIMSVSFQTQIDSLANQHSDEVEAVKDTSETYKVWFFGTHLTTKVLSLKAVRTEINKSWDWCFSYYFTIYASYIPKEKIVVPAGSVFGFMLSKKISKEFYFYWSIESVLYIIPVNEIGLIYRKSNTIIKFFTTGVYSENPKYRFDAGIGIQFGVIVGDN